MKKFFYYIRIATILMKLKKLNNNTYNNNIKIKKIERINMIYRRLAHLQIKKIKMKINNDKKINFFFLL